jgi:hypothetical protein
MRLDDKNTNKSQQTERAQRCSPSHLWCTPHGGRRRSRAILGNSRRGLSFGSLVGALLIAAPLRAEARHPDGAVPEAEETEEAEQTSFAQLRAAGAIVDVTAHFGAGRATISEDGQPLAELATGCFDARLGIGTFFGPVLKMGLEATVGDRRVLGDVQVLEPSLAPRSPITGDTWYFLPLGGYFELYPWRDAGVFAGVHVGVGTFWPAEYLPGGNIELAGAASVELGYEGALTEGARGAVALRYGVTSLGRSHIDEDYTNTLSSNELSLAARVSLF